MLLYYYYILLYYYIKMDLSRIELIKNSSLEQLKEKII